MKWKIVTRRTRILGAFTILSAISSMVVFTAGRQNPCVNQTELAPAPAHFLQTTLESSSRAHLLQVQIADDGTTVDKPQSSEYGTMADVERDNGRTERAHAAPCTAGVGVISRLRGISLAAFLVLGASTAYSFRRDRLRYAKRQRSRLHREEYRRRRSASAPLLAPRMPREAQLETPGICGCGCNEATTLGQDFVPGHAQMLRLELEQRAGGLLALRRLVEEHSKQIVEDEG